MKTTIPESITSLPQAKIFLASLYFNGESYHPEDDAGDISFSGNLFLSSEQAAQLNLLMSQIYDLCGDLKNGEYEFFDPCEFLLSLDPQYKTVEQRDRNENYDILKNTLIKTSEFLNSQNENTAAEKEEIVTLIEQALKFA